MNKSIFIPVFFLAFSLRVSAQETEPIFPLPNELPASGENLNQSDPELLQTPDESDELKRHRIHLNRCQAEDLLSIPGMSTSLAEEIIQYRIQYGNFIHPAELQAVPGFEPEKIRQVLPYLRLDEEEKFSLRWMLSNGSHRVLTRFGWKPGSDESKMNPRAPIYFLTRYRYQFSNRFSFGFTLENDAGEPWFSKKMKRGFDFYSGHIYYHGKGLLKSLLLGDMEVNIGQGLLCWTGYAAGRSSSGESAFRQAPVFKPYTSSNETGYRRGIALSLGRDKWGLHIFQSIRQRDINILKVDSMSGKVIAYSNWQTSGYHRTEGELTNQNRLLECMGGISAGYKHKIFHINSNFVYTWTDSKRQPGSEPYRLYDFKGNLSLAGSVDYHISFKNVLLFGELAADDKKGFAFLNGALLALGKETRFSLIYRYYSPRYAALHGRAFGNSSTSKNEQGLYASLSIQPARAILVNSFIDVSMYPWLSYRSKRPVPSYDAFLQVSYIPNRSFQLNLRYRFSSSEIQMAEQKGMSISRSNALRLELQYKISANLQLGGRVDFLWLRTGLMRQSANLLSQHISWKSEHLPFTLQAGISYFRSSGYESRIYAYEPGVAGSFTMPAFQGRGLRYFIQLRINPQRSVSAWILWAQTLGTVSDELSRKELRCQVQYTFHH